jgi:signal transduction histidine kinase
MGLGLYITREIVRLHGGEIVFEQPDHVGSRFVITLPGPTAA